MALDRFRRLETGELPAAQPTQSESYRPFKAKPAGKRRDSDE